MSTKPTTLLLLQLAVAALAMTTLVYGECVLNNDCKSDKTCVNGRCVDPCPGLCGENALCEVKKHLPFCWCLPEATGDPFVSCRPIASVIIATTTVMPGECLVSSDCKGEHACVNGKCVDPCIDVCGENAQCETRNHTPACTCPPGFIGHPFINCRPFDPDMITTTPVAPSKCLISSDCKDEESCVNLRCVDQCPGFCGENAWCKTTRHSPTCSCFPGFTGDPYITCMQIP